MSDPATADKTTGVILCSCHGTLFPEERGERLIAQLCETGTPDPGAADHGVRVISHASACTRDGMTALGGAIRRMGAQKVLFAGCSLPGRPELAEGLCEACEITPSSLHGVNIVPVLRDLAGKQAEQEAVTRIRRALRALAHEPAFAVKRIPLHQHVLVLGDGPTAIEAARAVERLGYTCTLVSLRAPASPDDPVSSVAAGRLLQLDGSIGAFQARVLTSAGKEQLTAGAVIITGDEADDRVDGVPLFEIPGVVPLSGLETRAAPLAHRRQPHTIGVVLDLELDESRASSEQALRLALRLQKPRRLEVCLFCRDIRVAALPLEELYGEARQAGVSVIKYTGTPAIRVADEGGGVTVEVDEAILGRRMSFGLDLLGVSQRGMSASLRLPAGLAGISTDALGRMQENNVHLFPDKSNRPGVFIVGEARGEAYLPQALREAQAAAMSAHELLGPGDLEVELSSPVVDEEKCALCLTCIRTCPFGAMQIDVEKAAAQSLPEVCRRCGLCAGECPAQAIELPVHSREALLAHIG